MCFYANIHAILEPLSTPKVALSEFLQILLGQSIAIFAPIALLYIVCFESSSGHETSKHLQQKGHKSLW